MHIHTPTLIHTYIHIHIICDAIGAGVADHSLGCIGRLFAYIYIYRYTYTYTYVIHTHTHTYTHMHTCDTTGAGAAKQLSGGCSGGRVHVAAVAE